MNLKPFKILFLSLLMLPSCGKDTDQLEETPKVNELIDFGEVGEPLFEKKDKFKIDWQNNPNQSFTFQIKAYSKFEIAIHDFGGEFYLYNKTEEIYITHNGGVLGGGRPELEFQESLDYSTELFAGDYEFQIRAGLYSKNYQGGTYELLVEDIKDLMPLKNLGVLTIPYNELHMPFYERARHTIYEFELSEPTSCHIFINGDHDPYPRKHNVKLTDEAGTILYDYGHVGSQFLDLDKGKYKLTSRSDMVLIFGNPVAGDIDLGAISSFPFNQEISLDYTYESDGFQRTYFEITTDVGLTVDGWQHVYHALRTVEGENVSDFSTIPPGKYYLNFGPDIYIYSINGDLDTYEYRVIQENITLTFTEN